MTPAHDMDPGIELVGIRDLAETDAGAHVRADTV